MARNAEVHMGEGFPVNLASGCGRVYGIRVQADI